MQLSKGLLLLLSVLCCVSALDHPNGRVRDISTKNADDRELFMFGGERECARQLSNCRQKNDNSPPPFEGWVDMINGFLGNQDGVPEDSLFRDLADVVIALGTLNFSSFEVGTFDWDSHLSDLHGALQAVVDFFQSIYLFLAPTVEVAIQATLDGLGALGQALGSFTENQVIPFYSGTLLPSLVSLVSLIGDISSYFAQDSLDVLGASTVALANYISTMASMLLELLVPREDDEHAALGSCSMQLLECRFDAMAIEVMPEVIGMTLTVAASEKQRRH